MPHMHYMHATKLKSSTIPCGHSTEVPQQVLYSTGSGMWYELPQLPLTPFSSRTTQIYLKFDKRSVFSVCSSLVPVYQCFAQNNGDNVTCVTLKVYRYQYRVDVTYVWSTCNQCAWATYIFVVGAARKLARSIAAAIYSESRSCIIVIQVDLCCLLSKISSWWHSSGIVSWK